MNIRPIQVNVVESSQDFITVKLPFLEVPVQMNHELFRNRMKSGYFHIMDEQDSSIPGIAS